TLAYAVMGHPKYEITGGDVFLNGESILEMAPDERSRAGIFLAFQYPVSIPGVTVANFLRTALNARRRHADPPREEISILDFRKLLKAKMDLIEMEYAFGGRYLNEGFSGGEKKRNEVLQLALLEPAFAILDETDSGLDIDAIRIVSEGVNALRGPKMGVMVITHYQRILNYLKPDFVHVMFDGKIVESGGKELALLLEEQGYDWIREKYGQNTTA
ncbi:MAG: Fe-S cluster assembly ATPase SufC, partial [Brevefilum sp.]